MPGRAAALSGAWPRTAEAAAQDRLRPDARIGLEARDGLAWDPASEHAFDVIEQLELVDADQRHGVAVDAGPAGPADAVDVVLGDHRQLEVDDVRECLDVEPARGDLGGDQHGEPAGLEVGQRAHALRLALVAVDRGRADAVMAELEGEAVGAVLGPGEDQGLVDPPGRDQVAQQLALALAVDHVDDVRHELGRRVARRDLDRRRMVEQAVREPPDLVREGRREEQVLATCRQDREDLADVADEAHVEHPVGLVEHEDLDPRQVDRPLPDVVEQPARGGDHDLRPGAQRADLRVEPDAAVDRRRTDGVLGTVRPDALLDLERELAGRGEDQRPDDARAGRP